MGELCLLQAARGAVARASGKALIGLLINPPSRSGYCPAPTVGLLPAPTVGLLPHLRSGYCPAATVGLLPRSYGRATAPHLRSGYCPAPTVGLLPRTYGRATAPHLRSGYCPAPTVGLLPRTYGRATAFLFAAQLFEQVLQNQLVRGFTFAGVRCRDSARHAATMKRELAGCLIQLPRRAPLAVTAA